MLKQHNQTTEITLRIVLYNNNNSDENSNLQQVTTTDRLEKMILDLIDIVLS